MDFTEPPTPPHSESPVAAPEEFAIDLNRATRCGTEPARGADSPASIAIGLALLIYLIADLALLIVPPSLSEIRWILVLVVSFTQVSLVVLWAMTCAMPLCARFAIAALATAWTWYVMITAAPWLVVGSAESAVWAAGLATQAAVLLAAGAARSLWRQYRAAKDRDPDDPAVRRWYQYSIGSLLGWTTLLAVLLGVGQTAATRFGWNAGMAEWSDVHLLSAMGVFNAAYALLIVGSLPQRRWLPVRIAVAGLVIAAIAAAQPRLLTFFFGHADGLDQARALTLAGLQTILLYATLLPVRLCHWRGENVER